MTISMYKISVPIFVQFLTSMSAVLKFGPSSDIVRIFRMAEGQRLQLVATPHEAQKTLLDQTL